MSLLPRTLLFRRLLATRLLTKDCPGLISVPGQRRLLASFWPSSAGPSVSSLRSFSSTASPSASPLACIPEHQRLARVEGVETDKADEAKTSGIPPPSIQDQEVATRLRGKIDDWSLNMDSIAQALALMETDGVLEEDLSDEHLFLYAKLILISRRRNARKDMFDQILNPDTPAMVQAKERLTRIVTTGETTPLRSPLEGTSFFDEFIHNHTEWAESKGVFVIFRDHDKLKGHAHVERYQFSGLCYMHAPVVMQHYLVAMNTQEQTPMLDLIQYIRQHMSSDNLYSHIWENEGSSSIDFLKGILAECPQPDEIKTVASDSVQSGILAQCLQDYGPGLVSLFDVTTGFGQADIWSHTGPATGQVRGRHAMLLIGQQRRAPVSSPELVENQTTPQTRLPDFPTNTETMVECNVDTMEESIPETA